MAQKNLLAKFEADARDQAAQASEQAARHEARLSELIAAEAAAREDEQAAASRNKKLQMEHADLAADLKGAHARVTALEAKLAAQKNAHEAEVTSAAAAKSKRKRPRDANFFILWGIQ